MGRKNNAFTLVELIIVIAIIAILVVIATAFLRGQMLKSNDARRKADLDRIKISLEEYEKDHNCYPLSTLTVCTPGTGLQPYIQKIPCDPVSNATYYYEYEDNICPSWYRVYAKLDNTADTAAMPFCGPYNSFNYYVSSPNAPTCVPVAGGGAGGGGGGGGGTGSTPPPSGGGTGIPSGLYGCFSGTCRSIDWNPAIPGPACDPHYSSSTCYGACVDETGSPINECVSSR